MILYDEAAFQPDRSIGYLMRRVQQMTGTMLEPVFAAEGLTGTQWQALVSIWLNRGGTAAALARDLGHDKGAMTRMVDQLEASGWIVRRRADGDRRCIHLALTPAGEEVAMRCKRQVIARWNAWMAEWTHDDASRLIALLQKLRDTLAEKEATCA